LPLGNTSSLAYPSKKHFYKIPVHIFVEKGEFPVTLGDLIFSLDLTEETLSLFPSLTEGTVKKEKKEIVLHIIICTRTFSCPSISSFLTKNYVCMNAIYLDFLKVNFFKFPHLSLTTVYLEFLVPFYQSQR
jgi:hypothetical protein